MTLRRYAPIAKSRGTVWPLDVREHVNGHQHGCIGHLAGMLGACAGSAELDHVRASHGVGMKSDSIATNAAQLCSWHHQLKTNAGKTWRPRLLTVIASLASECAVCQRESIETYGQPLEGTR